MKTARPEIPSALDQVTIHTAKMKQIIGQVSYILSVYA
jgi:hypothetical protein